MSLFTAKKWIAFAVLTIGCSFPFFSRASQAYTQLNDGTETASFSEWIQYLSTTSTDFQTTFDSIHLVLTLQSTNTLTLQVAPLASCSTSAGLDTGTQNILLTTPASELEVGVKKEYDFRLDTPTSTIAGRCYGMRIQQSSPPKVWGSTNADSWQFGVLKDGPGGSEDAQVKDAYFTVGIGGTIAIIYPVQNQTISTNFSLVRVQYAISSSTNDYGTSGTLSYGYTSSSLSFNDFFAIDRTEGSHIVEVGLSETLSPGILYLRGTLFTSSSDIFATSSLVTVTVTAPVDPTEGLASSTIDTAAYCVNFSGFQKSICSTIAGSINSVMRKPPFGYVVLFREGLTQLSTSTASSTYSLPTFGGATNSFFATIRNGLSIIFWLLLLVWAIIKFSKARF